MRIGLIDADNYDHLGDCFPNLSLMKLSAYHKNKGDLVEWYEPLLSGHLDRVYISKVFSFTPDYPFFIDAKEIIKGGTGYSITLQNGLEVYDKNKNKNLPDEIEHIYPDYSLYRITDTAYGFTSRGCPRGCEFCIVGKKEGFCSYKVADLTEWWRGQRNIISLDPNILACKDWEDLLTQYANTKALVDFNQGLDIRLMTPAKATKLKNIKIKHIHFAFDRYEDKSIIEPRLKQFKDLTGYKRDKVSVYVLCNFNTTIEQDLERVMFIRSLDFNPYVMLYDKEHIPRGSELRKLQRYCNNKIMLWRYSTFEDYKYAIYKN